MTLTTPTAPSGRAEPGSRRFIATLSMCMAVTALAIDSVLPAFADIRVSLGLADDATAVTGLITAFFLGNSVGLVPAGMLADRFGRRTVMWGGLAIYVAGAVASILAPTLIVMIVARFVWGLGAAGPRVAALAMVRDSYEGEQMARQMSLIMAVFILVPAIAPTLSSGLLVLGGFELVYGFCALAAMAVAVLVRRLPETLASRGEARARTRPLTDLRLVLSTPGTAGYLAALTALFAGFLSYLASSEILFDQVYDLGEWFPVLFGGIALVLGGAMLTNGRLVERLGLSSMTTLGLSVLVGSSGLLVVAALTTGGRPPFVVFYVLLAMALFGLQLSIPNLNTAAMQPLAAVAGSGAALLGMIPGVFGALFGSLLDRSFDGTVTPISLGLLAAGLLAFVGRRRAVSAMASQHA